MDREKLARIASAVRTGGKGTMRRKKKVPHKATSTDDKRLQSTLKRLGVNSIPGIEEVNIMKENEVIQFQNPKVQASIAANTYVVSGQPQLKKLTEVLPQVLHFNQNKSFMPGGAELTEIDEEEEDVPDLVENFEQAAAAAP